MSSANGKLSRTGQDRSRIVRLLSIAAATVLIGALDRLVSPSLVTWHYVVQHVFYVPVVYAGLQFGWQIGLATAALACLSCLPHISMIGGQLPQEFPARYLELPMFCVAGVLSGMLADRQRKQKRASEETARRLSTVYEELQENFERMKRAERLYALGQLSAGLAHEIRNPLASIAGAVGILRRKRASEEKTEECLEIINRECQRLNRLLTSFLDFARPRSPKFQTVSVRSLFDSVLGLAEHAVDTAPISLRGESPPDLTLDCDPEQLKQVLLNLIINAIQAMPEGGEVVMASRASEGRAIIEVRDQGCGVSPEEMEHLYDPFFTTKENGTGLGLPVAHQIVAQLGGVLAARNNPDRGVTFSIELPLQHRSDS